MLKRLRHARRYLEEVGQRFTDVPDRGTPSIARDLVVATMKPEKGRFWQGEHADAAVPGALLLELVHEGRVTVSGTGRKARIDVRDASPLGERYLDDALLMIASGLVGAKATRIISFWSYQLEIRRRLVTDGLVVEQEHRPLGMITVRRYHPTSLAGRDELVARLRSALLGGSVPDERTALLIALADTLADFRLWLPKEEVRQAHRRAEAILDGLGDDERAVVSAIRVVAARSTGD